MPRISAVFCSARCILRDSDIDPDTNPEKWVLVPATLEAVRSLSTDFRLLVLFDTTPEGLAKDSHKALETIIDQVEGAGGRVDATISCAELDIPAWGEMPWALWQTAEVLSLEPERCYLLADEQQDVQAAYAVGIRPIMVLGERNIGELLGPRPTHKDFPVATELTSALSYIATEDELTNLLGRVRQIEIPPLPEGGIPAEITSSQFLRLTSSKAKDLQSRLNKSKTQLHALTRWLAFFVLGAAGLSLGIAYLLTHLYRVQPFPDFVYYLTLQFIPRIWRGVLFVVWGLGIIVLALRSYFRTSGFRFPKRK